MDVLELAVAVWLYSFRATIFALEHGTMSAWILVIASLGVGLAVREAKEMV